MPQILREQGGAHEEKGEYARLSAFLGGIAVADLVKTTLGPKGMDKFLQSMSGKKITFTNDGATILQSIPVDNPAAKIIVDTSKTQDAEVGDGTTSVAVLAGELLREAEKLVTAKIHPQTIISGWRKAVVASRETLLKHAEDNSHDLSKFRNDLFNIAHTTLSSKILSSDNDYFSNMCVDAVMRLKGGSDLNMIQIIKCMGGNLRDSNLEDGFILQKSFGVGQKKKWTNPKIIVANTAMDNDKIKVYGAKVKTDSVSVLGDVEEAEKLKMKNKVERIASQKADVFINRQLIYNYPEQLFTEKGMSSVEHADFEGIERLALVLGAEIASTFDTPGCVVLGSCASMEEVMIGEDKVIRFNGVTKGEACTIVLRAGTKEMLDEAERSIHDALCVLSQTVKNTKTVLGGGCSEMLMAKAVDDLVSETAGKEAYAIEGFSRALRTIPTILADNAGFDSSELVSQLRVAHAAGQTKMGLDMNKGIIGCMKELRITESYKSKLQVLVSAHEAAEVILRVDDIIRTAPRQRREPDHGH